MQCHPLSCWNCRPSLLDSMLRMALDTLPRLENTYWLVVPIRLGKLCRLSRVYGSRRRARFYLAVDEMEEAKEMEKKYHEASR